MNDQSDISSIYSSTATQTSGSTVFGLGYLSGRAIKRLGEAVLNGYDYIVVNRQLRKMESYFAGYWDEESSDTREMCISSIELTHPGYPLPFRTRALSLIMTQIGTGKFKGLVGALKDIDSASTYRRHLSEVWDCVNGKVDVVRKRIENVADQAEQELPSKMLAHLSAVQGAYLSAVTNGYYTEPYSQHLYPVPRQNIPLMLYFAFIVSHSTVDNARVLADIGIIGILESIGLYNASGSRAGIDPPRPPQFKTGTEMGSGTNDEDERVQTLPAHAIEAPFRLTPNRYAEPNMMLPAIDIISTRAAQRPYNKYFVVNRTSMESITSLAVSVQQQQPNGSVDSFGSASASSGSGSGSTPTRTSRGSDATLDAPLYDNQYFASGTSYSQDSFSLSNPHSSSTGPSTPTYSYSIREDDIGHAHEGYDVDDDRVYVDDRFDDPTKGDLEEYLGDIGNVEDDIDLDDLGELEAAPGSPDGSDYDSSSQGGSVVGGNRLKAASASHSPLSPMTYARDDDSDSEALGGTESIASLAVSVQQWQPNRSVDSFGSGSTSSGFGSGSTRTRTSRGSGATLDAPSYDNQYFASGTSHSQDSLSLSNLYSSSTDPSTPMHSYSIHEDDVGHAHEGYDVDDNRVYVDDGFDDPTEGYLGGYLWDIGNVEDDIDLDDLGEFEAAPESPDGSDHDSSSQGGSVVGGGAEAASSSHRPLSPMTFAGDDDLGDEALGGMVSTHVRHSDQGKGKAGEKEKEGVKGKSKALANTVYDFWGLFNVAGEKKEGGKGKALDLDIAYGDVFIPARKPPMPFFMGEEIDDLADILEGEMEMEYAKHTSSSVRRERRWGYVPGLGGLGDIDEEKEYIRGKWRTRSRSPELENGIARSEFGGLRRYQSEESMGIGGGTDDEEERAQILPAHAIEAPFKLTPNRHVHPEPLPLPPMPGMKTHPAHRIRSHQGRSPIFLPHYHIKNKPIPPSKLDSDYAVPSNGGAAVGIGELPGPFPFLTEHKRKEQVRGVSVPGKKHGWDYMYRDEYVRKQLDSLGPTPTRQVSYEVWVERGLSSGPGKKNGVLTKPTPI
ncbi:hypothetical protein V5O48_006742 [Marasmius crinis-equi]|uniref:Uncharacterized protein n=1 Tax=Marasmius crinis-equi TaxID=585013 RepID=A0ABR3FIN3_9AGAR